MGGMSKITPICHRNVLVLAKVLADYHDWSLSTISRRAQGDPRSFDNIKAGTGSMTLPKYDATIAWFKDNWPADLPWPESVRDPFEATAPAGGAPSRFGRRRG